MTIITNRHRITVTSIIILAFVGVGCSKNSPTSPTTTANVPNVGSSFTIDTKSVDAQGQTVKQQEYIAVVAQTGVSYAGHDNLVKIVNLGVPTYLGYEANGDLSELFYMSGNGMAVDSAWVTIPYGSHTEQKLPDWDRTINGLEFTFSGSTSYIGSETVTVAAGTFATQKVQVVQHSGFGLPGQQQEFGTDETDTIWYAPSVMYTVKQSGVQISNGGIAPQKYYNTAELKSYTLQ